MFELLATGEQADEMTFGVERDSADDRLIQKMVLLGLLEYEAQMYSGDVVKLTGRGLQALAQARHAGVETLHWSQEHRPVQFHQTVHGTAYNQVGDRNTMTIHMAGTPTDHLLKQLAELRALTDTLPEDDREEARSTLDRAQQAANKGMLDRLQTYGPTLMSLATGSVEFASKVRALFGL